MNGIHSWPARFFFLACVILVPFLKFVAWNEYGFLHPEVLAAIAVLALPCLLLSRLCRGFAFYAVTLACLTVIATYPLQKLVWPVWEAPAWLCAALLAAGLALFMLLLRVRFFPLMALFLWSGFAVESLTPLLVRQAYAAPAPRTGHLLWLVLDEHLGLAGFPAYPECAAARIRLTRTLRQFNFTLYPNAYSNYAVTADSLSSLLNGKLLNRSQELIAPTGDDRQRHYRFRANRTFTDFAARGFHVEAWQHGALLLAPAGFRTADSREYQEKLGWLHRAPGGWRQRFRWLVGSYQSTDPLLLTAKGFFPFRFGVRMTGPLAVSALWPEGIARRVLAQPRRSLLFAHLLTPHFPYLYRADGAVRPLEQWADDRTDERLDPAAYESRYRRYCGQVEFVASQLDALFRALDRHGLLGGMTVIVQGDHGSRIRRRLDGSSAPRTGPDEFDYPQQPPPEDLRDRFSALLAIKAPGATSPVVDEGAHSLLTVLSRRLHNREPEDGLERADRVYLINPRGFLQGIPMQPYGRTKL